MWKNFNNFLWYFRITNISLSLSLAPLSFWLLSRSQRCLVTFFSRCCCAKFTLLTATDIKNAEKAEQSDEKKWNQAEWRTWDLKAFPRRLIKSASTLCLWSSPSFRSSVDYIKFRKQSAATFRGNKHLRIRFNAAATSYITPPNQSRGAINFR